MEPLEWLAAAAAVAAGVWVANSLKVFRRSKQKPEPPRKVGR